MRYTEEQKVIINDPEYLHRCTNCGIPKPNKQYTRNKRTAGRQYVSWCKECRSRYVIEQYDQEARRRVMSEQKRKHRLSGIYNSAKSRAKRERMEFDLTLDYLKELLEKQKGLCFYTGVLMFTDLRGIDNSDDGVSIDRVNSSKGYTKDNIVLCRWVVNRVKNDLPIEKLIEVLKQIEQNVNLETSSFSYKIT